jgi:phosphate-selective porin OprO and OprP
VRCSTQGRLGRGRLLLTGLVLAASILPTVSFAQSSNGEPVIGVSGYVQTQYERGEGEGAAFDRVFFRRLVIALSAKPAEAWEGVVQVDVGPVASGDRLIVKDAYLRYTGLASRGLAITIGNQKMPFSRSVLTSSSRRSVIERPFPGDKNFGSPGRSIGVKVDGWTPAKKLIWSGAVASTLHAPDLARIRLDGLPEAEQDWNQGAFVGGRLELHPFGEVALPQADFRRGPFRATAAVAAFAWRNDGDVNSGSPADLDRASAFEVSGALRGRGVSLDVELDRVSGETVDASAAGGLVSGGRLRLTKAAVEGGYMIVPRRIEIVGSIDRLAADALASPVRRAAVGASWYLREHSVKLQVLHRESFSDGGTDGLRARATFVMTQLAF